MARRSARLSTRRDSDRTVANVSPVSVLGNGLGNVATAALLCWQPALVDVGHARAIHRTDLVSFLQSPFALRAGLQILRPVCQRAAGRKIRNSEPRPDSVSKSIQPECCFTVARAI